MYRAHDLDGAKRCVADTGRRIESAGSVWGKCWIEGLGAVVACDTGDIREAEAILERSRAAAVKSAGAQAPGPRTLAALYAAVRYEQDWLSEAEAMLEQSWPVEPEHGWVESHVAYYRTKARLQYIRGRQSEADACLADGVAQAERLSMPRMALWLASERISLQLVAGASVQAARAAAALRSRYEAALDLDDQLEFRIVEIHSQIAAREMEQAMQPLNKLVVTARRVGSLQTVVQTICLKAALLSQCGRSDEALRTLDEALVLGLAGGLCRTLVDLGGRIGPLLRQMLARRDTAGTGASDPALSYLRRIVGVLDGNGESELVRPAGFKSLQIGGDAFSERELQIIRLIATGLGNRETAAQLFLSEATIKWHLQNIYGKLKVSNRAGAIAQAFELRLV